jgi:MFS family permease
MKYSGGSFDKYPMRKARIVKKIFYGWWIVISSFFIAFYVGGTVFFSFTAFIEPVVREFGWSYAQVSFAASLRGMEMGIMAPVIGFLVDRFGSRKLLVTGIVILGFGIVLLGCTHSLLTFYASFILMAFGAGGCTSLVTMTVIANWFERNVGKALGVMVSGFGACGLLVPVVVWLIDEYGWRTSLFTIGIGTWILLLPVSFVIRDNPEDYGYAPDGFKGDEKASRSDTPSGTPGMSIREAALQKNFLFVCLSETIRLTVLSAVMTHIMPYLGTIGMARTTAGFVAAGIPLLSVTGRFGFGWLGDVFEKKLAMAAAFGLMTLGMIALCHSDRPGFIYAFLFLFANGFGGIAVLRGSIVREYYGRAYFGRLIGILMGFGSFGGIIGPTVAGWVFDRVGSYFPIWIALSVLVGAAVALVLAITPNKKNSSAASYR